MNHSVTTSMSRRFTTKETNLFIVLIVVLGVVVALGLCGPHGPEKFYNYYQRLKSLFNNRLGSQDESIEGNIGDRGRLLSSPSTEGEISATSNANLSAFNLPTQAEESKQEDNQAPPLLSSRSTQQTKSSMTVTAV